MFCHVFWHTASRLGLYVVKLSGTVLNLCMTFFNFSVQMDVADWKTHLQLICGCSYECEKFIKRRFKLQIFSAKNVLYDTKLGHVFHDMSMFKEMQHCWLHY